jgi:hypothetical protein
VDNKQWSENQGNKFLIKKIIDMKKINLLLFISPCCISLFAQEFSTKFYFETAQGEKDTLEIGYDPAATHSVDAVFGEVDYGSPVSPDKFQAFVVGYEGRYFYPLSHFYLKKQIIRGESDAVPIIVPYDVLPVTIMWDKSQFEDPKRIYSVITDWTRGSWFDAGYCTFKEYLKDVDSVVILDPLNTIDYGVEDFEYIDEGNKILYRLFFVAIGDNIGMTIPDIISDSQINIFPNPVDDICFIKKASPEEIRQVQVFSVSGSKMMEIKGNVSSIDCSNLPKGTYILTIETSESKKVNYKLIKK